jgi:sugar lactone lactonase YvrE
MNIEAWSHDRYELAEGPRWVSDRLVWTDILSGRLLERGPGTDVALIELDVPLGAVAPLAGRPDRWLAAAGTGIAILTPPYTVDWIARPAPAANRMNDAAVDPDGRFIATSMAYDTTAGAGALYRVDHDGSVSMLLNGITVPNGPAWSADGDRMYLADSARGRIDAYPYGRTLGEPTLFAHLEHGSPDGMCTDTDGNLWVAIWGESAVHCYAPHGRLLERISVPTPQPSSVHFGGPELDELYITSAWHGLDARDAAAGAVFRCRPGATGLPDRPAVLHQA